MTLKNGPGMDVARHIAASETLYVYFTSLQWDWSIDDNPHRFDYLNTAIREGQSALFFRDRANAWYHLGVDGAAGSVHAIADLIRTEAAGRRIVTIGPSMGGYAALLIGHLVGAELAIGIVPQIRVGRRFCAELQDTRFADFPARVDAETPTPALMALDLAVPVQDSERFWAVVGSDAWIDLQHLRLVEDRPDFRIIRADGCSHNDVGTWCLKSGLLPDVFKRF